MEYETFLLQIANYLPKTLDDNKDFVAYLKGQSNGKDNMLYDIADYLMMTLPAPRVDYY